MIVNIRLQHFRSYSDSLFEFNSSVNIIVGPNASGKTNLIEALLFLARGSSYRAADSELIAFNKPWARLKANVKNGDEHIIKIKRLESKAEKLLEINGQSFKKFNRSKALPAVLFEPNNLIMLTGRPELRRLYLDDLIEQTKLGYGQLRRQYKRTLAQRNALLKRGKITKEQLFAWNVRLSELGGHIVASRLAVIEDMNNQASLVYNELTGAKEKIKFVYQSSLPLKNYATSLLQKMETNIEIELERGFTLAGPHRDDLEISIDNHLLEDSASRGEVRTMMLVCKILEARLTEQSLGKKPILLLDDVFSELDGGRRQALTRFLKPYQTFITTTDADVVVRHFTESAKIIPITLQNTMD